MFCLQWVAAFSEGSNGRVAASFTALQFCRSFLVYFRFSVFELLPSLRRPFHFLLLSKRSNNAFLAQANLRVEGTDSFDLRPTSGGRAEREESSWKHQLRFSRERQIFSLFQTDTAQKARTGCHRYFERYHRYFDDTTIRTGLGSQKAVASARM